MQKPARPATRITIAILVHAPYLSGFYRGKLDVIRLCLSSVVKHSEGEFDLLVLDNGSCRPVAEFLDQELTDGRIRYLLRSRSNLGVIGGFSILFRAAPGEIVAYSDDDVFFYPGWLRAQLRILEAFPKVGMVSGLPVRGQLDRGISSNLAFARSRPGATMRRGRFIPDELELEFVESTGRDLGTYRDETSQLEDIVLEFRGVSAFGAATHFQFLAPWHVMDQALRGPWTGSIMGGLSELDSRIDDLGYLRLSTLDRYVRHMGNVITPALAAEARRYGLEAPESAAPVQVVMLGRRLAEVPWIRGKMHAVYSRMHGLLRLSEGRDD